MKKTIAALLVTAIVLSAMGAATLAACGGGGRGVQVRQQQAPRTVQTSQLTQPTWYTLCLVTGCELLGPHQHDGVWYCAPCGGQYAVCLTDCDILGLHEHDSVWYGGAYNRQYPYCGVEGCPLTGLHEHDGIYYHNGGGYGACGADSTGRGCGRGWNR